MPPHFVGFSTLYGSKWVATRAAGVGVARILTFQYPLRVEVGCNTSAPMNSDDVAEFQYPLRVEVGCNRRIQEKCW